MPTATLDFALPATGEVRIGRAEHCDIQLDDETLSREHTLLRIAGDVTVVDLGSANGTVVGGRRLAPGEAVILPPAVVVSLGAVTMLVQSAPAPRLRPVRTHEYFEAHLEDECARAEITKSGFVVGHLRAPLGGDAATIEATLAGALRQVDVIARYAEGAYEFLLVEVAKAAAGSVCDAILQGLEAQGMPSNIGIAEFPSDGQSAEALIAAASGRARASLPELELPVRSSLSAMDRMGPLVDRIAASNISVLLLGETGVGKEVLAKAIHARSSRAAKPLVSVNCAAMSESLLEAELFGYERGAFTGAVQAKPGLFESADGGTVFLDEAGEMPLALQAKLLRVLEDRHVVRLGSVRPHRIDVRFIAATNRDMEAEVARGRVRSDLYFRLNGISLVIPPLRERVNEIGSIAQAVIEAFWRQTPHTRAPRITREARTVLERHTWPGNIRELKNAVERAVLLAEGDAIEPRHLPMSRMGHTSFVLAATSAEGAPRSSIALVAPVRFGEPAHPPRGANPAYALGGGTHAPRTEGAEPSDANDVERERIARALEACAGNQTHAARALGISRGTLIARINQYGIARPRKRS